MIDFRYHLVSIVAVFLALAIGIVLGSTELQGNTLDAAPVVERLAEEPAHRRSGGARRLPAAGQRRGTFLQTAEPKLLARQLDRRKHRHRHRARRAGSVVDGIKQAATLAGATVTGTVALQPKFNDLSGATQSSLRDQQLGRRARRHHARARQQPADHLPAAGGAADRHRDPGPARGPAAVAPTDAQHLLSAYAQAGYLTDQPAAPPTGPRSP